MVDEDQEEDDNLAFIHRLLQKFKQRAESELKKEVFSTEKRKK